jgi:hypothetical protein
MMRSYDRNAARDLVPLLESITRELTERRHEARVTETAIRRLRRQGGTAEELTDLRAILATHKREIRLALAELERLGCSVDTDRPSRVLIPGVDGSLEGGYAWDPDEAELLGDLQALDSEASPA